MFTATWKQRGPALLETVRRDGTGIIRGWRELSTVSERHLIGKVYRSEVSVEVDGEAHAMLVCRRSAEPALRRQRPAAAIRRVRPRPKYDAWS